MWLLPESFAKTTLRRAVTRKAAECDGITYCVVTGAKVAGVAFLAICMAAAKASVLIL